LTNVLVREGYETVSARDGQQALSLFHQHARELVLIVADIAMPKLSGPEFIDQLPTLLPRVPVIFISGLGEYQVRAAVPASFPVLQKPFTPEQLVSYVKSAIADSHFREVDSLIL